MKNNDMDYLNSFCGCTVINYKSRMEGKKYIYGFLAIEFVLLLIVLKLTIEMIPAMFSNQQLPEYHSIVFGISLVLTIIIILFYKKNMNIISEYTLHITDALSETDRKKICDNFSLHPASESYPNKEIYVAYPKKKGRVR